MSIVQYKKGFTLIELLLYVSIAALLLLAISAFSATLLSARVKNQTIAEVEQQGAQALAMITQTVRNADSITSPGITAGATSLVLAVTPAASSPTVFDVSAGALRIKQGAGATMPLTNSRVVASNPIFSNMSRINTPGTVRIQFTLAAVNNSGRNEYSFTKTFTGSATLRQP